MNYSRYLYFKTLVVSIIERCSELDQTMTPIAAFQQLRLFLESIEGVIRFEIQKIKSKQDGGYWQVTKGDKIFIDYMNNTLAAIDAALGKTLVDQNEWHMLINHLQQLLVNIEIEHNPRIKAVFLVQETFTWPSFESVYEAFVADPFCEAYLIYVPFEHENSDKYRDWFAEYKDRGLPIIHYQDYDLSEESPDLVFFVKPYDSIPKQFYIDDIDKVVSRSIYIPYFVNWMAFKNIDYLIDYHFRLPLHNKAWKIFDAPNYARDFHAHYGFRNGENVEMVGHPRFDSIHMLAEIKDDIPLSWKNKISQKTVFMWNTHAPMGGEDKKKDDWATFELFGQDMLSYFSVHKEVALLWRPHPMFFNTLINNGIMTANEIEELRNNIENSENIILDTLADYRYAFSVADALVSDASSLLVEFLGTNKPIMYSCPESTYYLVNEALLPAYYKATNWLEIENFLEMVKEGRDDIRAERTKVIKDTMVNLGKHIGEIVKESCVEDLKMEEMASPNKAVSEAYKENTMNNPTNNFRQELIDLIMENLYGRMCYVNNNCNYLAWAVTNAGDGDHLEIGTLHGGSAILAALIKKDSNFSGDVWCVDPLDGYYMGTKYESPVDLVTKIPVTKEQVLKNSKKFGVEERIKVVAAKSVPWPKELPQRFVSTFIDGDHSGDVPLQDWRNVKDITEKYVIFDNANEETNPDVMTAVREAANDPEWELIWSQGVTVILKRRQH